MTTQNADKNAEKLGYSYTAGGNVKWQTTLENSMAVPRKTKHITMIQLSNSTLGIYSREGKIYIHTETYKQMFIATLFFIVKN